MFAKILIANRGEIACRVMATARRMGIGCVAVFSDADAGALHVRLADEAVRLGPAPATESYLRIEKVIEAARRTGAEAVHPGYGFLSENAAFAEACAAAGLVFIGPPPAAIRAMGLKDAAKTAMEAAGVPIVPGYHGTEHDPAFLAERAAEIGFPVLLKAVAGGGGKGMRQVEHPSAFLDALESARREAASAFGDGRMMVEKLIPTPRHIEIQVFADSHGNAVHLFERDCSLQRRHQKVVEEAPAPGMLPAMRQAMGRAAIAAARAVGYVGAGTVEFIADATGGLDEKRFYFMEMNTRLQVEHPVTEAITGQDLVEWQLRVAAGEPLPLAQEDLAIAGHAVEARLYAEDPARGFLPATGTLRHYRPPAAGEGLRLDSGVEEGDAIGPHYDPMIAKLIAHGPDRASALARLGRALDGFHIAGCRTNIGFLSRLLRQTDFAEGRPDTGLIERDLEALTARPDPPAPVIALAVLDALGFLQQLEAADPWSALAGFRLWGPARQLVHLRLGDETLEIATARERDGTVRFEHGGQVRAARLVALEDGEARIALDGVSVPLGYALDTAGIAVFFQGALFDFALPDAGVTADPAALATPDIRAPLPGRIAALSVAKGQAVEAGARLLVLEAMKMEHTLTAPRAATVAEIACAKGDQVEEGALLLRLDVAADG